MVSNKSFNDANKFLQTYVIKILKKSFFFVQVFFFLKRFSKFLFNAKFVALIAPFNFLFGTFFLSLLYFESYTRKKWKCQFDFEVSFFIPLKGDRAPKWNTPLFLFLSDSKNTQKSRFQSVESVFAVFPLSSEAIIKFAEQL